MKRLVLAVILAAPITFTAPAQEPVAKPLRFEVVSITREYVKPGLSYFRFNDFDKANRGPKAVGNRMTLNREALGDLIQDAYNVDVYQLGKPAPLIFPTVEKLGLKLEGKKGPVEILVIDGVERPSDN